MLNEKKMFSNGIITITTTMSYDPNEQIAHFEATGTEPSNADFYRMMQYHQEIRDKNKREREEEARMRRNLYNMYENDDQMRAEKRNQREGLMSTSTFNVKSIMPKVKILVANKQFLASGNASQSVIGNKQIPVKGGRRTRHKRSGHKKRSAHKRSGHKRSGKRSGRKSRRR